MIRDGVQAAGAFEKREIMGDEAETQKYRAEAAGDFPARAQEADVRAEAQDVGEHRQK